MSTEEPLEPWDASVARLLESERNSPPPSPEVASRMWDRVSAGLAEAPSPSANAPGPGVGALASSWRRTALAACLGTGVGLLGGAAIHAWWAEPVVHVVTIRVPVPIPAEAPAPNPAPEAAAVPMPGNPAAASARTPSTGRRADASGSQGDASRASLEAAGLDQVRVVLARGDALGALETLAQQNKRFAGGLLQEDRAALRVVALSRAGRLDEARRAAQDFLAAYPGSIHRGAVEKAASR